MTKLLTLLLFVASLASAQTITYTAPIGSVNCFKASPYQQWYQNLVENSTPPYPNPLQPNNFQMPAFPNHPIPVASGACPNMGGFVSPDGLYTATLQSTWLRIYSNGSQVQVVELSNPVWTAPSDPGASGTPVAISMDATIIAVCDTECHNASGTFHLEGQWAYQWAIAHNFRWNYVEKVWSNTVPVTITINEQSGLGISD